MTTLSSRDTPPLYFLLAGVALVMNEDLGRPEIEILMHDGSACRVDFELIQEAALQGHGLLINHDFQAHR